MGKLEAPKETLGARTRSSRSACSVSSPSLYKFAGAHPPGIIYIYSASATGPRERGGGRKGHHGPRNALLVRPDVSVDQRLQLLADPRQHAERAVGQRIRQRHRLRAHDLVVAALVVAPPHHALQALLLGGAEPPQEQPGHFEGIPEWGGGGGDEEVDVDADAAGRVGEPHEARDEGAPVAALRDVRAVAEGLHQLVEHGGGLGRREPGVFGGGGEAEAGERRRNDVEGSLGGGGGFGEQREELLDLEEGAGPAVDEDERDGIGARGAVVGEMHGQVFAGGGDRERELLEGGVQTGLGLAPVVVAGPEGLQGGEGLDGQTVGPAAALLVVDGGGHTAGADAVGDEGEKVVGDGDCEGSWDWK